MRLLRPRRTLPVRSSQSTSARLGRNPGPWPPRLHPLCLQARLSPRPLSELAGRGGRTGGEWSVPASAPAPPAAPPPRTAQPAACLPLRPTGCPVFVAVGGGWGLLPARSAGEGEHREPVWVSTSRDRRSAASTGPHRRLTAGSHSGGRSFLPNSSSARRAGRPLRRRMFSSNIAPTPIPTTRPMIQFPELSQRPSPVPIATQIAIEFARSLDAMPSGYRRRAIGSSAWATRESRVECSIIYRRCCRARPRR
jgi:hypothetical protein